MPDDTTEDVLAAIALVQRYLRDDYIVDECRNEPTEGCASCAAIELEGRLDALAELLVEASGAKK